MDDRARRLLETAAVSRSKRDVPRREAGAAGLLALVALLVGCACGTPAASAGSVSGLAVDDASGHGLPGITVTIQTAAGKVVDTVVTAPDGSYDFPTVPAGQYEVVTYFRGFKALAPVAVSVAAGSPTNAPPLRLVAPDEAAGP